MVVPKKKAPLTKDEEVLKKKLKKLFKFNESNIEPSTSSTNSISTNQKSKTATTTTAPNTKINPKTSKTNTKKEKLCQVAGSKRKAPIKETPATKKSKKYSKQNSNNSSEFNCSESYSTDLYSDESDDPKVYTNKRNFKSKSAKIELSQTTDSSCDTSDTEDSEDFVKLTKLATKMLKNEQRINKTSAIKKNGKSSSIADDQGERKSINKNENCKKIKVLKKSECKSKKQIKYSCKDYSDSSENVTDDTSDNDDDSPGPSTHDRKTNKKKTALKSNDGPAELDRKTNKKKNARNPNDDWKIESIENIKNKCETESVQAHLSDHNSKEKNVIFEQYSKLNNENSKNTGNIISIEKNSSSALKVKIEKKSPPEVKVKIEKNKNEIKNDSDKYSNVNGRNKSTKLMKKLTETEINERRNKENNQKLLMVPYNSNRNLHDNDSADEEDDDIDEIMKFYGLESSDDGEECIDEEEDDEDCSLSNTDESDSEDTDSEGNSCVEEDYDNSDSDEDEDCEEEEYTDDSEDNENYNFESESNDEDYNLPENCEEDLYIPQGIATKYDINGYDIEFDSENEAQIIEIPTHNVVENIQKSKTIQNYESDDSCPQLVPISYEDAYQSQNMFDFSDDESLLGSEYSDCCSEYSEATEGSLCIQENLKKLKPPPEATTMLPEIFDLSSENLQNPTNSTLNQLVVENLNSEDNDENEMEIIDNPLEKIINILPNISNSSISSYKITTINNVEVNNTTSKISQSQLIRRSVKNNISNEIITEQNNLEKFETKFYNAIDSCHVLVLLRDPIYIYGTIKLKLITGNIEIFGYQPHLNETLEIFSPRGYSFLDIKSINNNKQNIDKTILSNILLNDDNNYKTIFLKYDLIDIIENYNTKTDSLILITRNDCNKKIEMLRKYMKENLFPNMNSITLDRPFYASEFILHCLIRIQSENSIRIDPKWQTIKLNSQTKSMIIGGKSVGKSTLLRYLINKNLSNFKKIIFIDLDIGQPELFIPQTISVYILDKPLLGPGYFLGLEPKKSFLFGDINAILSPIDYLKNIQNLLKYCQETEEFQNIPWLINTMGYVKGFGNELIAAIIKYLQPTDVIQLQSSRSVNNFDYLMYPNIIQTIPMNVYAENDLKAHDIELKHRLILFDSIINGRQIRKSSEWDMNSKDMRYAMIVTRLGATLNKFDWLTDVKPVCTPIDDIEIINFGEDHLTKDELLDVINANLVYLCNKSINTDDILCYGIGIVRGIDRFQRKIYLLPAVPIEILVNVNCFAFCNIPLPTSILLNQGPKVKGIVPYAYNTNKVIASKSVHQLYNRGQKRRSEI